VRTGAVPVEPPTSQAPVVQDRPVVICLLGGFSVRKRGAEIPMRGAGKTATLLTLLALGEGHRASRDRLLGALWPDSDASRSAHALSSMVHGLNDVLGDALHGALPVLHRTGAYELNVAAGVAVDAADVDALSRAAGAHLRAGDTEAAVASWTAAVDLYRGDLVLVDDLRLLVERERLRADHLAALSRLADHWFATGDYERSALYAGRLVAADPCREDAHRQLMRCHVRLGHRAQALRQYRVCEQMLQAEFGAPPEPLTRSLFEQVRLDPGTV
jgi:DNA-binding SARP family transcriptional activator